MNRRNKITLTCTLAAIAVWGLTFTRAQIPSGSDMYGYDEYSSVMYEDAYDMAGGESYDMYGSGMMPGGMPGMPSMGYGMGYGMGGPEPEPPGARALNARLAPVLQRLRDAGDDQEKEAIQGQLSSILEDYFERDLQRRTSEIDAIEQRVQRLRDQLEQRQQAKEEILQLQLRVLENEAAGLGFFSRRPARPGYGTGMMGDMGMGMSGGMMTTGRTPLPAIPAKFQKRVSLDFQEISLDDAFEFLRDHTGANIYVDQHAFKEAGVDSDALLSLTLNDASVATVLELITESLSGSLGVRYEDGIAVLGTRRIQSLPQQFQWGSDGTQPSQQTESRLADSVTDYHFIETPLSQVLEFFRLEAEVDVFVNERTLDQAGVSVDAPVTIDLRSVRHRTALRLILDSVDKSLHFAVVDGLVVVSALQQPAPGPPG